MWDLKRDIVYKNDEMHNLMRALDIERLGYDKVILATDADVDGLHIRNLLITYFFKFFKVAVRKHLVHDWCEPTGTFRASPKLNAEGERALDARQCHAGYRLFQCCQQNL